MERHGIHGHLKNALTSKETQAVRWCVLRDSCVEHKVRQCTRGIRLRNARPKGFFLGQELLFHEADFMLSPQFIFAELEWWKVSHMVMSL